jgi:ankyrin repeat protein
MTLSAARDDFIREAVWHGSLVRAEQLLVAHPELAAGDIHVAAILGDYAAVRRFLERDPSSASAKSGPFGADALNYLGLSKYLRLDESRTPEFVRTAAALLDAGADPNTGFWTTGDFPEYESAMYGAAGVAHNPEVTRLLLERGADPNDGEVVYHSPETQDNRVLELLVETGKLTPESLAMMLIRKIDWHDIDGVKYLLEHGAPADGEQKRGWLALHHALARGSDLEVLTLLLDHGADPRQDVDGLTAIAKAAREGRDDVLGEFERRGVSVELDGVDRLVAACACDDFATVHAITSTQPELQRQLIAMGGSLVAKFTSNRNAEGVWELLDLGVSAAAPFENGDPYFGIPKNSLPIHVAAWRAQPGIVRMLIERGSPVDVADANGNTPLMLAVRACVDSFWMARRSPDSVAALLAAGATTAGVTHPCGYDEVDALLRAHDERAQQFTEPTS